MPSPEEAPIDPTPLPEQLTDLHESLIGLWGLTSREDFDLRGERRIDPHLGPDPLGVLAFSAEHFSAQFMKRDRSDPITPSAGSSVANNSTAVDGYDAYFGTYSVTDDESAIIVRLEGSIAQQNVGQEFTRTVRASDHELFIRLTTATDDGTPIIRTLRFERLH